MNQPPAPASVPSRTSPTKPPLRHERKEEQKERERDRLCWSAVVQQPNPLSDAEIQEFSNFLNQRSAGKAPTASLPVPRPAVPKGKTRPVADSDGFVPPRREETAAQKLLKRWQADEDLTRDEQRIVNELTQRKRPQRLEQAQVPLTNTFAPLTTLSRVSGSIQTSTKDTRYFEPRSSKFEASNHKKAVESAIASTGAIHSNEPEPSVGSKIPQQYAVGANAPEAPAFGLTDEQRREAIIRDVRRNLRKHRSAKAPAISFGDELKKLKRGLRPVISQPHRTTQFGPSLNPGPTGPPDLLRVEDEPGGGILGYRERRLVYVNEFPYYVFPHLDFIGWWNHTTHVGASGQLFVDHLGLHFHERDVEVRIPAGLVDEMGEWWNHRLRTEQNFALSVTRCRTLISELAISADELRVASLYAPAIAYLDSDEQQNVSRVRDGAYLRSAARESYRKTALALETTQGRLLVGGALLVVGGAVATLTWGCSRLQTSVAMHVQSVRESSFLHRITQYWRNSPVVAPPEWNPVFQGFDSARLRSLGGEVPTWYARLVGVEPNPGPSWFTLSRSSRRTHGLTSCTAVRQLVNCVNLPRPTRFKDKAKLTLSHRELRAPLHLKTLLSAKGKHVTYGFDTKSYAPTGFASNQHNEEQALVARVLCRTDEPTEDLMACLAWCKRNHRELFPYMHKVVAVSFDVYLERSNASPSVKRVLRIAHDRLVADGITEDSNLTKSQLYQMSYRSSFVKVENDLYTSPAGRKNKAPRLIQGATPEFICLVGPWIMALQDLLKRRWNTNWNMCFTSGVSADQAAAHISAGSGPWLEDDLGKFDSSIRREWCEYEVWLCRKFGAPRVVLDLMTANIATHGATLHGWRYKCDGTRKSGDPYTSLMNSIINCLSHAYLYCKWTDKTVAEMQLSLRMLAQGDDNCLRHAENVQFPWRAGMSGLGFDSEAVYRSSYLDVEFCSNRLYETDQGLTFGPKPGRVLAKLGYVINPPANVSRESMMRGIALGLQRATHFIPPLDSTVRRILELTDGNEAWFERKQFTAFEENPFKVRNPRSLGYELKKALPETMLSLNRHYDWDYGKQQWLEDYLATLQLGDAMTGLCELFFDRDTSGPQCIFGGWTPQQYPEAAA